MRDYPQKAVLAALRIATDYGLDYLDWLESLVLRHIAGDCFPLPLDAPTVRREGGETDRGDAPLPDSNDDTQTPEDDDDG